MHPPPISPLFPYTTLFRSTEPSNGRAMRHTRPPDRCGSATATSSPHRSGGRSEEHTSELQSHSELVCRLLLEKKKAMPHYSFTLDWHVFDYLNAITLAATM